MPSHHPLELGELPDHLGDQVALGERGGPLGQGRVEAERPGDAARHPGDPAGTVEEGAEALLEHDPTEGLGAARERDRAVLLPEEVGVRQAGPHHPLVARAHRARVHALHVRHRDEVRQEPAVPVDQVEVALVALHGGDEGLGRDLEEARVESARQGHGPLHQAGDLAEQGLVDHRAPAEVGGDRLDLPADALAPRPEVDQHPAGGLQPLGVLAGRGQGHGAGVVEAVAAALAPRAHPQHLRGHHVRAEEHDHPVHGAHELHLPVAPAHALGDGQARQRLLGDPGEQAHGRRPDLGAAVHEPAALVGLEPLDLGDVDAAGAGEAERRLCRPAFGVVRGAQRRAPALHGLVGLAVGDLPHEDRQPAGGGEFAHLAVGELGAVEACQDARPEGLGQPVQRLRWQLLGADLDQQVTVSHGGSPGSRRASGSRGPRGPCSRPRRRPARGCAPAG